MLKRESGYLGVGSIASHLPRITKAGEKAFARYLYLSNRALERE